MIADILVLKVEHAFRGDGPMGNVEKDPRSALLEEMLDSRVVFAPCGNVMEAHHIYNAIMNGAIPIIENCEYGRSSFTTFGLVLVDGGWSRGYGRFG